MIPTFAAPSETSRFQIVLQRGISSKTKTSLLKSKLTEALLYDCDTWTLNRSNFELLRQFHHHHPLLRCVGFQKKKGNDVVLAYHEALAGTINSRLAKSYAVWRAGRQQTAHR